MEKTTTKRVSSGFGKVEGATAASPAIGVVFTNPFEYEPDYLEKLVKHFSLGARIIVWLAGQLMALKRDQTVLSWPMSQIMTSTVNMMWWIHSWTPHLAEIALRVMAAQVEGYIFHLENGLLPRGELEKWGQSELESIFSGKLMGKSPDDLHRNQEMRKTVIEPLLRISRNEIPPGFNSGTHERLIEFAASGFGGEEWHRSRTRQVFNP